MFGFPNKDNDSQLDLACQVDLANRIWHSVGMDETEAREILAAAIRERDAAQAIADQAREHLYEAVRTVAPVLKQVEIVRATGWTREHVRKIAAGTH